MTICNKDQEDRTTDRNRFVKYLAGIWQKDDRLLHLQWIENVWKELNQTVDRMEDFRENLHVSIWKIQIDTWSIKIGVLVNKI